MDSKQRHLGFREDKAGKATIQADQNLGEYQDPGFVEIPQAGEVDHNLSRKFRLIARRAQHARHIRPYEPRAAEQWILTSDTGVDARLSIQHELYLQDDQSGLDSERLFFVRGEQRTAATVRGLSTWRRRLKIPWTLMWPASRERQSIKERTPTALLFVRPRSPRTFWRATALA
jgi:hypothetical protein